HDVAAGPALAAARTLVWHLAARLGGERLEHRLAAEPGVLLGLLVALVLQSAEIAAFAIEHVLDDVVELAATTARSFAQLLAVRGPGGAIQRLPARLEDLDQLLVVWLVQWLAVVRRRVAAERAHIRGCVALQPLADLELLHS